MLLAGQDGDLERVESLLRDDDAIDGLEYSNEIGDTALTIAASKGYDHIVTILLDRGAKLHHANRCGCTALLNAAYAGETTTVRVLLDRGADIHDAEENGRTALHLAAWTGRTDTVQLLLDRGANMGDKTKAGTTAFILAGWTGKTDTVQRMLDLGADVHQSDINGCTALHRAAREGHAEVIQLLLERGAHVDHIDNRNRSVLFWATNEGKTDTVRLLLEKGADLHHINSYDRTVLMQAAEKGRTEVVKLLVKKGADLHYRSNDGRTALLWACEHGRSDTVKFLLACGAASDSESSQQAYYICTSAAWTTPLNKRHRETAGCLLNYRHFRNVTLECYTDAEPDISMTASTEEIKNVRTLTDILHLKGFGEIQHSAERRQIHSSVIEFVTQVCHEMRQIDQVFDCKPVLVGSVGNGTKAGLPDEFDFIFEMEKLFGEVKVIQTETAGVVEVRLEQSLSSINFKERFVEIFCDAVARVLQESRFPFKIHSGKNTCDWNKVCTQINLVYTGGSFYKNLPFSIDATPAIKINGTHQGVLISKDVSCYHVVPKPASTGSSKNWHEHWSLCSATSENFTISNLSSIYQKSTIVIKAFLNQEIHDFEKRINQISQNEEITSNEYITNMQECGINVLRLFSIIYCQPKYLIDSYYIKMALLHVASTVSLDLNLSEEDQMRTIVIQIFLTIQTWLADRKIPHPFITNMNVLEEDKSKIIEGVPAALLRERCIAALISRISTGELIDRKGLGMINGEELFRCIEHSAKLNSSHTTQNLHEWFISTWDKLCDHWNM